MTDIGSTWVFLRIRISKITAMDFQDMDWIDNDYQSTSDTKVYWLRVLVNGAFAQFQGYGKYMTNRRYT